MKKIPEKESPTMPKRTERRDPLGFFNIHSVAKHRKIEGGSLCGNFFPKKVSQCQKTERGEALVSTGTVCYAEKEENPFWFSSLGQMIQFGTIKFL